MRYGLMRKESRRERETITNRKYLPDYLTIRIRRMRYSSIRFAIPPTYLYLLESLY